MIYSGMPWCTIVAYARDWRRVDEHRFFDTERAVIEGMPAPLAVYQFLDKHVVALALSDGFCRLFGYQDKQSAYDGMNHMMYRDTHPDDVARIEDAAFRFASEGEPYDVVYRTKDHAASGYKIVHAIGEHVYTAEGIRLAYVWYTDEGAYSGEIDAQEAELNKSLSKALREEGILKASHHDYLTGLPRMTYFFELAEAARTSILEEGGHPALLYMDLCGMKFYNNEYGFAAGDKLLQSFAKLLIATFNNERCGHLGADHFTAVAQMEGLEETLQGFFDELEKLNGGYSIPVHVGIYPDEVEVVPANAACDRAKFACSAVQNLYASSFSYYKQEERDRAELRQHVLSNLDRALEEKWVQVYYQPIIRAVNRRVCDEEALSRWIDPERGLLPPIDFIPALEDAGLAYKLDLYVLEQVLEKIKTLKERGHYVVSQSINLSRSDFDNCDIVEEVCKRVDAAGIDRGSITIEITESTISQDFDFMKAQVARFQELGFPVWIDDFGSGYSSLDVLQSIKFDLIKFDMSFMQRLSEDNASRIVLTELVKMATVLGVGTLCEGVETIEQARFLQEIGCSRLQGYLFSKPLPLLELLEWHKSEGGLEHENPEEAPYYDLMGRVNLYDLNVIMPEGENPSRSFFSTLPMGIIEIKGNTTRFVRCNQSYREFAKRFFYIDLAFEGTEFVEYDATFMYNIVRTCCEMGTRSFYDERMPDGSIVHSFARRVGINPINGNVAVAIVVLSIMDANEGATYTEIARALAANYYRIYYVDLATDNFVEYSSTSGEEELAVERHGEDFFNAARGDAMTRVYEEDREHFLASFSKEQVLCELDDQGVFMLEYRLIESGSPVHASMKAMRMQPDEGRAIFAVSWL